MGYFRSVSKGYGILLIGGNWSYSDQNDAPDQPLDLVHDDDYHHHPLDLDNDHPHHQGIRGDREKNKRRH